MTRKDYKNTHQELRYAQMELMQASNILGNAGMRLQGTNFYTEYKKAWDILFNLNDELIKEIKNNN